MAELKTMYEGVANSPETFLRTALASGGTVMYVADNSVFGKLPNLAVIGNSSNAETVLITSERSDQGLNIKRGVEGTVKSWEEKTVVARNFTNYDYDKLKENINILNKDKANTSDFETITDEEINGVI